MKKKENKQERHLRIYYIWFILTIITIVVVIILSNNDTFWEDKGNLTTLIGSGLSLIALGITLSEIYAIADIAVLTRNIVQNTKDKIKNHEDIAAINGVVQTINGSLEDINNLKFVSATLKLREVKKTLVTIYEIEKLESADTVERQHYDYVDQTINSIGHLKDGTAFSQPKIEAIHIQLNQVSNKLLFLNKKIKQSYL